MTDRLAAAYWTPINELTKWEKNPRNNTAAIPQVARSIRKYGFVAPVVVWQSRGRLVAGHTRLAALESLLQREPTFIPRDAPGAALVPVRFHEFVDEAEANAYALADNKLSELADWQDDQLAQILLELRLTDETLLAHTGFADAEIEALIRKTAAFADAASDDPGPQIERAAELQDKWQTAPAQLWEIPSLSVPGGVHRLLCGDSRRVEDALRVLDGHRARWCWTDPPYGVRYVGKTAAALEIQNDDAKDLPELLNRAFAEHRVRLRSALDEPQPRRGTVAPVGAAVCTAWLCRSGVLAVLHRVLRALWPGHRQPQRADAAAALERAHRVALPLRRRRDPPPRALGAPAR